MWPMSARAMLAMTESNTALIRVEAWSNGVRLSGDVEFSDGSVKDEWKNGARRSLSLSVPQNRTWLRWLALPHLELRPYRGVRLGDSTTSQEWAPLGRFEIKARPRTLRGGDLSLSANDLWQRVIDQTFEGPRGIGAVGYRIKDLIVELIVETGIRRGIEVDVTATSEAVAPEYLLEKTRDDAINEMATAISAEAFVDREGALRIQDAQNGTAPVWQLGGLKDVSVSTNWAYVKNVVIVKSTAQDVNITARAAVSDPNHPAHRNNLGSDVVMVFSSPLITTQAQADQTAATLLWKHSWPARQLSITMMPNPALDAGDVVYIDWGAGTEPVQIQSITHPLTLDGDCSITTVGADDV